MDLSEDRRVFTEAGTKDAQANLLRLSRHMQEHEGQDAPEYERTYPHMEAALRAFAAKVWDEGAQAMHDTATEAIGYNPGGGPANPYKD
jgi:hypothetical protein